MADFQDTFGKKVDDVIDDVSTALLPLRYCDIIGSSAWSDVTPSLLLFSEESVAKLLFGVIRRDFAFNPA